MLKIIYKNVFSAQPGFSHHFSTQLTPSEVGLQDFIDSVTCVFSKSICAVVSSRDLAYNRGAVWRHFIDFFSLFLHLKQVCIYLSC